MNILINAYLLADAGLSFVYLGLQLAPRLARWQYVSDARYTIGKKVGPYVNDHADTTMWTYPHTGHLHAPIRLESRVCKMRSHLSLAEMRVVLTVSRHRNLSHA